MSNRKNIFADATAPEECSDKNCNNTAGCTVENGEAKCFCMPGYKLLENDTCVGEYS